MAESPASSSGPSYPAETGAGLGFVDDIAYLATVPPSDFASQLQQIWEAHPESAEKISLEDYTTQTLEWNAGRGEEKPMGYIPLDDLVSCRPDPGTFIKALNDKDIKTRVFRKGECSNLNGALYSYSPTALQSLLDANRHTLVENDWPTMADEFVEATATKLAPAKTPLFDLVADAFADKTNILRSDVDPPTTQMGE